MQSRRHFISTAAAASLVTTARADTKPGQKLRFGVMGLSRGKNHISNFAQLEGVEIAYVGDVDKNRLSSGAKRATAKPRGKTPTAVTCFRRVLVDKGYET
ncbi:MAG: gfo/Idh/MocA family oxidoreductase, partial [Verrucomicrobiaceae bacterium]|nr:gfo/Idh/MocA family oxidoreductase [Verrucomicrobiaceae bacterium]